MRVFTMSFVRSGMVVVLLGLVGVHPARADEALRRVQQSLREQGFYYGPIDGAPGDETTQALRRYQIRNGLAVNGQLNDETSRSVERTGASSNGGGNARSKAGADASTPPPLSTPGNHAAQAPAFEAPTSAPAYRPPPARPAPGTRNDPDDAPPVSHGPGNIRPDLRARPDGPPAGGGYVPRGGVPPSTTLTALFASTPYEFAPPPVQADVLRRAQAYLTRNGFYDGGVDGVPGAATSEALTNFQEVNRLRRTGRLDVSTLGTMRLLPGRQTVSPRREDDRRRGPDIVFPGRVVDRFGG